MRAAPVLPVAIVVLAFSCAQPAYGQAPECQKALDSCKAQCAVDHKDFVSSLGPRSNYQGQCEYACTQGLTPCQEQDSANACETFFTRCVSECPWKVRELYTGTEYENSDPFQPCGKACATGDRACKATPSGNRTRTGSFDACVDGQAACYAFCMAQEDSASSFPDDCARACHDGVEPCQEATVDRYRCGRFFANCLDSCPDIGIDEDFGEPYAESREGQKCGDSCKEGERFCDRILK